MKKYTSALALAAILGAPAIASAQTEIRPYLTADVSLGFQVDGDNLFKNEEDVDYHNGNLVTSNFGLRASHDLGNGLTAHGQLEGDFNTATGDVLASGAFRRGANVGLEGAFGRVDLGTKGNPFTSFHGASYAMGGNTVSSNTARAMGYGNFFTQKSVTYSTPKLAGFSAQLQYGFEDATPDANATPFGYAHESVVAGYARYEIAGLTVGAAAMDVKGIDGVTDDKTAWMAAVSYQLGALQLNAAWIDNDDVNVGADDNTAWQVGLKYAVNPQLAVGGNYFEHDSGSFMVNLQARYAMTKNVVLYGMVNHVDNDAGGITLRALDGGGDGAGLTGDSGTAIATGMIVSF